jgi:hypothetical protein
MTIVDLDALALDVYLAVVSLPSLLQLSIYSEMLCFIPNHGLDNARFEHPSGHSL